MIDYIYVINYLFILVFLLDRKKDQKDISWIRFLPQGVLTLLIFYLLYKNAAWFWYWFSETFITEKTIWNWNDLFKSIPLNDGSIFQMYHPHYLTVFMQWVYNFGFILALEGAVIRSFFVRDVSKMIRYMISSHLLQLPIIVPFYMSVMLQEVWYVYGNPDQLERNLSGNELLNTVQNCFPSMHTSVAFSILLLSLRERAPIFKWTMVSYCSLVIFSTLYLQIHWVLDVAGGLLLGYSTVKLADVVMSSKKWPFSLLEREKRDVESYFERK